MEISMETIDRLRERANITYREARDVLEHTGGDLIEALVYLEENKNDMLSAVSERSKDIYRQARHLAGQMHRTRMKVKIKENTVVELPVTVTALGTALFPKLAALGVIGLLVSHGSIEVNGRHVSVPADNAASDESGD